MSNITATSQLSPAAGDLDLQCTACLKSWPVVVFLPAAKTADGKNLDGVCSRCADPAAEQRRWTNMYYKMEWRMQQARRKSEGAFRHTSKRVKAVTSVGQAGASNPSGSQSTLPPQVRQQASNATPTTPACPPQAPPSAVASTIERIAQPALNPLWSHQPRSAGLSQEDSGWGGLAPLPVRLLNEPQRAMIWFQTFYKPDPMNSVSQNFLYQHYISSMVDRPPTSFACLNLSSTEASFAEANLGRPVHRIPELLKGVDFMRLVPTIYPGIKLAKVGYLCMGIRRRTPDEVDQGWRNVLRWMQTERILMQRSQPGTPTIPSPLSSPSSHGSSSGRKRRKHAAKPGRLKLSGLPPLDSKKTVVDLSSSSTRVPLSATGYPPPSTPTKDSPLDVPDVSHVHTAEHDSDSDNPFSFQPPGLSETE